MGRLNPAAGCGRDRPLRRGAPGSWKVEVESRLFLDVAAENSLASFEADDFLTLRLSRYF